MKALVKCAKGEGNVKLMDVPVPTVGDDEALIQVKATGVCGSDLHIYHGTYDTNVPLILGHEYAGRIVKLGASVKKWQIGDRVAMENNPGACGKCAACRRGSVNICPHKRAIGFRSNGCFAEYIKAPVKLLHRISDGLSYNVAALAEPMAVAVHATYERGALENGDWVAIFGPGSIGMMCALVAKKMGAAQVTLVGIERDRARLELARSLGIDVINCQADSQWREPIDGVDLAIDASGNANAIRDCFELVSRSGRFVPIGITGLESIAVPWDAVLNKETTVAFSYSSKPANWDMALSILADDHIECERLISETLPLAQWRKAFDLTAQAQHAKVMLIP